MFASRSAGPFAHRSTPLTLRRLSLYNRCLFALRFALDGAGRGAAYPVRRSAFIEPSAVAQERWPGRRERALRLGHFDFVVVGKSGMSPAAREQCNTRAAAHSGQFSGFNHKRTGKRGRSLHANHQSARAEGPRARRVEKQGPGAAAEPAEARRVHARVHDDAEEAELRAAQGRQGAAHQRLRGDQLHRRRRPQPAGALGRADPRRPREGPAGRALPHGARQPRHRGRQGPQAGALEVRRQEAQGGREPD